MEKLPTEILGIILGKLSNKELCTVMQVSQKLKEVAENVWNCEKAVVRVNTSQWLSSNRIKGKNVGKLDIFGGEWNTEQFRHLTKIHPKTIDFSIATLWHVDDNKMLADMISID